MKRGCSWQSAGSSRRRRASGRRSSRGRPPIRAAARRQDRALVDRRSGQAAHRLDDLGGEVRRDAVEHELRPVHAEHPCGDRPARHARDAVEPRQAQLVEPERAGVEQHRPVAAARQAERRPGLEALRLVVAPVSPAGAASCRPVSGIAPPPRSLDSAWSDTKPILSVARAAGAPVPMSVGRDAIAPDRAARQARVRRWPAGRRDDAPEVAECGSWVHPVRVTCSWKRPRDDQGSRPRVGMDRRRPRRSNSGSRSEILVRTGRARHRDRLGRHPDLRLDGPCVVPGASSG